MFAVGQVVKYSKPDSIAEGLLRFTVLEDRGDRVEMECVTPICGSDAHNAHKGFHSVELVDACDICDANASRI